MKLSEPATKLTAQETYESLTGFDEIAVAKAFDRTPLALQDYDAMLFGRALVFALKRREGLGDVEAKHAALSLTNRELEDYFADEADEAGKDDSDSSETPPEN